MAETAVFTFALDQYAVDLLGPEQLKALPGQELAGGWVIENVAEVDGRWQVSVSTGSALPPEIAREVGMLSVTRQPEDLVGRLPDYPDHPRPDRVGDAGPQGPGAGRTAMEHALAGWAARQREQDETRDGLVRGAVEAGVSKHRVHVLTGIARTTIDRIMTRRSASGPPPS